MNQYLVRLSLSIQRPDADVFARTLSSKLRESGAISDLVAERQSDGSVLLRLMAVKNATSPTQARSDVSRVLRAAAQAEYPRSKRFEWPTEETRWPRWLRPTAQHVDRLVVSPSGGSFVPVKGGHSLSLGELAGTGKLSQGRQNVGTPAGRS